MRIPVVFFFFMILCSFLYGCAQKKTCTDFRNGAFYQIRPEGDTVRIQRADSIQYESRGRTMIVTRVLWLTECEYQLQLMSILESGYQQPVTDSMKNVKYPVKIISSSEEYYVIQANRMDGSPFTDTIRIGRKFIGGFKPIGETIRQK